MKRRMRLRAALAAVLLTFTGAAANEGGFTLAARGDHSVDETDSTSALKFAQRVRPKPPRPTPPKPTPRPRPDITDLLRGRTLEPLSKAAPLETQEARNLLGPVTSDRSRAKFYVTRRDGMTIIQSNYRAAGASESTSLPDALYLEAPLRGSAPLAFGVMRTLYPVRGSLADRRR